MAAKHNPGKYLTTAHCCTKKVVREDFRNILKVWNNNNNLRSQISKISEQKCAKYPVSITIIKTRRISEK